MENDAGIARRQVEIVNTYGLHLRPSSKFVKLASSFQSKVWVHYGGSKANGKSLLDMTSLAAERGTMLNLEARGPTPRRRLQPWPSWWRPDFTWTKREPEPILEGFLRQHARIIPRTMLRFAIERFPEARRKAILGGEDGE